MDNISLRNVVTYLIIGTHVATCELSTAFSSSGVKPEYPEQALKWMNFTQDGFRKWTTLLGYPVNTVSPRAWQWISTILPDYLDDLDPTIQAMWARRDPWMQEHPVWKVFNERGDLPCLQVIVQVMEIPCDLGYIEVRFGNSDTRYVSCAVDNYSDIKLQSFYNHSTDMILYKNIVSCEAFVRLEFHCLAEDRDNCTYLRATLNVTAVTADSEVLNCWKVNTVVVTNRTTLQIYPTDNTQYDYELQENSPMASSQAIDWEAAVCWLIKAEGLGILFMKVLEAQLPCDVGRIEILSGASSGHGELLASGEICSDPQTTTQTPDENNSNTETQISASLTGSFFMKPIFLSEAVWGETVKVSVEVEVRTWTKP